MNKPGRNDPCPCGSGKKYKHCHQAIDAGGAASSPPHAVLLAQLLAQANISIAQGKLEEALQAYRLALKIEPARAEIHSNLGSLLEDLGRIDEAIACYREAVRLNPKRAELHNNLGLSLQARGELKAAEEAFEQAIALKPDSPVAHFNLARLAQAQRRHLDAAMACRRVIALQPDHAQAYSNLAFAEEELGRFQAAVANYRQALAIAPQLASAHKGLCSALVHLVPEWHVPMMNDDWRNQAYYDALRAVITPSSNVFEIGTGSGLLAMMAAKLGAKTVTTCEAEPTIAQVASEIIAANGLQERIRLLSKKSNDVRLGSDLAQPADIMVSEILSSELLGERVLSSIEDAKQRLLAPGARIIPAAGSIMIAAFGGEALAKNLRVSTAFGFDLRLFNRIVPRRHSITRTDLPAELLSAATEAFRFDFQKASGTAAEEKTLRLPVTAGGRCYGLLQWIKLEMVENIVFENHPSIKTEASGWTRCAYLFAEPLELTPGETLIITATHNRIFPWFSLAAVE